MVISYDFYQYVLGTTSITIPNSVTTIGHNAFSGCSGLTSIVVEEGNSFFDSRDNCNAIIQTEFNLLVQGCNTTIIPSTVTAIGNYAFSGCSGLTSVSIPISVTSINYYVFEDCTGLTSISIPASVTSIGQGAFQNCSGLTSISIPASVTSIGNQAFYGCIGLISVYCHSSTPTTLGSNVFNNNYSPIYVPCGSQSAYQSANNWSDYASCIFGTPYLDYTIVFASNNDTMGVVSASVVDCDSNVTVTATANTGYQFDGWSDGGTGNPRIFHIISDTSVTAIFDYIRYAIVGQSSNAARGTVTGGDTVYYGDSVTLTAVPNYGYHFQRWNDNNTDNPRTVVAAGNTTYTAYFNPNTYSVTVHSADSSKGSVTGSGTYNFLTNRQIRAVPVTGHHFTHWSDGDSNATRTISVTQDTILTAYFEINSYQLTVLPNDSTLGSVTGSGTFTHGSQVTVTATPVAGNRFDRWSNNTLYTPYSFTLTNNLQLIAVFMPTDTVLVHDTTYIHDTTIVDNWIYDTTIIVDTLWLTLYDTLWLHDTVIVHDTIYITQEGIGDVAEANIKLYQRNGRIVVDGAAGREVYMYDINGRLLATKQENCDRLLLDVPASGAYLIKVGNLSARKVVVIRN